MYKVGMVIPLTDQTEPDNTHESHNSQDRKTNPQSRRDIQAQPEEPLVGSCHSTDTWVGGLKDPLRVAR